MITLPLKFVGKADKPPVWPDIVFGDLGMIRRVAVLEGGMKSGQPSVVILCERTNGEVRLFQTSARLFCVTTKAIMARYPELFDD